MQYSSDDNYGSDNYRSDKAKGILLIVAGGIVIIPSSLFFIFYLLQLFLNVCLFLITAGIISMEMSFRSEFNTHLILTIVSGVGVAAGAALVVWGTKMVEWGSK